MSVRSRDFLLDKHRYVWKLDGKVPEAQLWRDMPLEKCSVEFLSIKKVCSKCTISSQSLGTLSKDSTFTPGDSTA